MESCGSDGVERKGLGFALQSGERVGGLLTGGQVDDQLLFVRGGKFEGFPVPSQFMFGGRVAHPQLATGRGRCWPRRRVPAGADRHRSPTWPPEVTGPPATSWRGGCRPASTRGSGPGVKPVPGRGAGDLTGRAEWRLDACGLGRHLDEHAHDEAKCPNLALVSRRSIAEALVTVAFAPITREPGAPEPRNCNRRCSAGRSTPSPAIRHRWRRS